jgi:hypothetical protein
MHSDYFMGISKNCFFQLKPIEKIVLSLILTRKGRAEQKPSFWDYPYIAVSDNPFEPVYNNNPECTVKDKPKEQINRFLR